MKNGYITEQQTLRAGKAKEGAGLLLVGSGIEKLPARSGKLLLPDPRKTEETGSPL